MDGGGPAPQACLWHAEAREIQQQALFGGRQCAFVACAGASHLLPPPDAKVKGHSEGTSPSRDPLCAVQNAADSELFSDDEQSPRAPLSVAGPAESPFASAARDPIATTQDSSSSSNSDSGTSNSRSDSNDRSERSQSSLPHVSSSSCQAPFSVQLGDTIRPNQTPALAIPIDRPLPVSSPEELLSPHQRQRRLLREKSLQMRQPLQLVDSPLPLSAAEDQSRGLRGQPLSSPQPHPRLLPRRSNALEHAMSRPLLDPSLDACAFTPLPILDSTPWTLCRDICGPLASCCLT